MRTSTKDDVRKLAVAIETLAKEMQNRIDKGSDLLTTANELVRNNLTLVFALGEVSGSEHAPAPKKTIPGNYHKVRDSSGRFAPKK